MKAAVFRAVGVDDLPQAFEAQKTPTTQRKVMLLLN